MNWINEAIIAHRKEMSELNTIVGLDDAITAAQKVLSNTAEMLLTARSSLSSEKRKLKKLTRLTQNWNEAKMAHKASYLIHDSCRAELQGAIDELDKDFKTLKSRMNPTAAAYSSHPWEVDVDVYIYTDTPITDKESEAYFRKIKKCLRGEFFIDWGCGDRGFTFFADDADWNTLDSLLAKLECKGCNVEFPDWNNMKGGNAL